MARHIDVDRVIEQVVSLEQVARKRVCDTPTNSPAYERYKTQLLEREKMLAILKAQPTADVVPKSEFDKLLISSTTELHISMEKLVNVRAEHPIYTAIKSNVAIEVIEDLEKNGLLNVEPWAVENLKKKYTGDNSDGL